ncbi:hypothetical protein I302_108045 [Kwoniella bestiolae CBS 10118]|uniref:Uncharacterized protein n=1 Tax=Kwoniella bestiolae CBS 10118 TaxID=1296100 RepID=A0A1B9FWT2_9TREE|nr:hypothetical protein I302_07589 [Kwoniella bestiolae CBS 10118]OCF23235.1 hypothetical protein I302_07589 [Kwoniella bestiolae CBS 10118]
MSEQTPTTNTINSTSHAGTFNASTDAAPRSDIGRLGLDVQVGSASHGSTHDRSTNLVENMQCKKELEAAHDDYRRREK